MPVYEYACGACGNRFELRQGFDSKPKAKCPKCNKIAPRMISAPPIVFKGSGFYKNDARGADTSGGDSSTTTTPTVPDLGAAGHGHSHGPGGHSHDTPAPSTATESKSTDSKSDSKPAKKSSSAEAPAAG